MKKYPYFSKIVSRINDFGPSLQGVYTYKDLFHLIGSQDERQNVRIINRLVDEGILFKVQRGVYINQTPDLWFLAKTIKPDCYISMDTVLSKNAFFGTITDMSISAIAPGIRKKFVKTPSGIIRFFSIKEDLIFGVDTLANGVRFADNEKAYLDLMYFYLKGERFMIDPRVEILMWKFDYKKIRTYLKRYKNPKFVSYIERILREPID